MHSRVLRRAAILAASLAVVASAVAVADTVTADGDSVTAGVQASANLGAVAPGAVVAVDVPFTLACKGTSHVAVGSSIAVVPDTIVVPAGGALAATAGSLGPVPSGWPEPGAACPDTLKPSLVSAAPSHVTITAPNAPGTGYGYTVLFVRDPEDGLTSMTAVSFTLDVVEPAPVDTTPPALLGVPADITVETHDAAGAVVTWPAPTATDDTDPAPVVGCTPASGSTFPVGASAVTCSATDASGNVASGTFTVTVLLVHVPQLSVRWAPPLGGPHPLIVGPHGRVVPVRVAITIDGTTWRPASGAAPELRLDRLAGCGGPGLLGVLSSASLGPMRWNDGRWMRRLDARSLAPGCWRLAVSMGGFDAGAATLVVTGEPPGRILAGLPRRPH